MVELDQLLGFVTGINKAVNIEFDRKFSFIIGLCCLSSFLFAKEMKPFQINVKIFNFISFSFIRLNIDESMWITKATVTTDHIRMGYMDYLPNKNQFNSCRLFRASFDYYYYYLIWSEGKEKEKEKREVKSIKYCIKFN